MDSLDVLDPATRSVACGEERLEIRPLVVGALPIIVRAARPVIDALLALDDLPDGGNADMVAVVMDLIENHGDKVFAAVGLAVGKEPAWVEALDLSEFLDLAMTVFEVNRDFFVQKLGPLLAARARRVSGDGPTSSSSSSIAATA